MSKHTPGPWTRGFGNHVYQGDRPDPANLGRLVAVCEPSTRTKGDWDQVWANAKLIAAAPELLEALIDAQKALELAHTHYGEVGGAKTHWGIWEAADSKASAAIAKATGNP
jgi:hypothetical protein